MILSAATMQHLRIAQMAAILALVIFATAASLSFGGSLMRAGSGAGDVNCNNTTNSIDAALVLQFSAGLVNSLACGENGDMNADERVDSIDAALILQCDAGLIECTAAPSGDVVYTGTHAQGGTIRFVVSEDGTEVTGFRAEEFCDDPTRVVDLPLEIRVVGQFFEWERARGEYFIGVSGTLMPSGSASGTVSYAEIILTGCHPQDIPWTATAQ